MVILSFKIKKDKKKSKKKYIMIKITKKINDLFYYNISIIF